MLLEVGLVVLMYALRVKYWLDILRYAENIFELVLFWRSLQCSTSTMNVHR